MNIEQKLQEAIENLKNIEDIKDKEVVEYSLGIKFTDGHIHSMLPDDSIQKEELVQELLSYTNIESKFGQKDPPEKIVFKNRQAIGDILTFTCAVRDFKTAYPNTEVGVISTAMHIWDHNPHINHQLKDNKHILDVGPGFLTNKSNLWNLHMANAFRIDIQNKTGMKFKQGPVKPDIWMTREEYNRDPLIEGPYWVLIYGGEPGWPAKQYHRWQEVVDILKDDVQIVQLGVKGHPYPHLDNVIDYIGKTEDRHHGLRDLFNIFLNSQGSIGLVSMHTHLSAAFGNPSVTVAGAREPAWFTNYFGHQYIQTNGTMACATTACWACKLEACRNKVDYEGTKIPKCTSIIEPDEIAEGVRKYYKGGRLEYGKKVPNTAFKNITEEARIFVAPVVEKIDEALIKQFGYTWGGDSITDRDWMFIKDTFKEEKIKTVLEFGTGLATLLMGTITDKVISLETDSKKITDIQKVTNPKKHTIRHWDGVTVSMGKEFPDVYDIVFVDGPPGGANREWSMQYASEHGKYVMVHDAGRDQEKKWQTKHLEKNYEMISKGGHRCSLWKRKDLIEHVPVVELLDNGKPVAKMVTTTRGYGGSERSTLNIMQMLLDRGYNVELVSTSNVSGEYGRNIPKGVQVTTDFAGRVTAPCDLMVLYASDTIWSYNKEPYTLAMPHVQAKRKVMVLNFKLGGAGQVGWTKGWDKYLFLNSTHEKELIQRMPGIISTAVMAPPTPLEQYFENTTNYSFPLKLIRHNSQGDNKHHIDTNSMIRDVLRVDSSIEFHYMPAYSKMMTHPQIYKHKKNQPPVWEFLRKGNCFWYRLPDGYTEGGPKVIMEAMASGLCVIADNHSGPKDRVTEETGWLCDSWEEYLNVIRYIVNNPNELMKKGIAAREYAKKYFVAEKWIEEILNVK